MDFPFWETGSGNRSRVKKLISFLLKSSFLTVVYIGRKPAYSVKHLIPAKVDLIILEDDTRSDKEKNISLLTKLLEINHYNVCIIEYIHLSYFLKCIPDSTISILDAHDIVSDSNSSFNAAGLESYAVNISRDKEYKIFSLYDYVMFITQNDFDKSIGYVDDNKMIVTSHAPDINYLSLNKKVRKIGFIASSYTPNVLAINWFLEFVWPELEYLNLELHIFGSVCKGVDAGLVDKNVHLRHYQAYLEPAYKEVDIVINPVKVGAGLKIKNVEALGYGKPLITTRHGSSGLEAGANSCFLIAESVQDYIDQISLIYYDDDFRKKLSRNAHEMMKNFFNEDVCYSSLKKIITN